MMFSPSFAQESIWIADRLSRATAAAYNEPVAFHIQGELSEPALRQALRDLIGQCEALRTVFLETRDGLRCEVVRDCPDVLLFTDISDRGAAYRLGAARELLIESCRRPFDLSRAPLVRAQLVKLARHEFVLGLTFHHIVTDDWSNRILLRRLGELYRALISDVPGEQSAPGSPPALQFPEYAAADRGRYADGGYETGLRYFAEQLKTPDFASTFPHDRPPPARRDFSGGSRYSFIQREEVAPLLDLCRTQCQATPFAALFAAFGALLSRYTGQDDVVIGSTLLGRPAEELQDCTGCFANTTALRLEIPEEATFRDLARQAARLSARALSHSATPYAKVLDRLGIAHDPSFNPVFQVMFTMLGELPELGLGPATSATPFPVPRSAAKFDLLCYLRETANGLVIEAEYNTGRYDQETVDALLGHYRDLLVALAENLDVPIAQVPFISDAERLRVLKTFNDTSKPLPEGGVLEFIEDQVGKAPERIAVEFESSTLSYAQLYDQARGLAAYITASGAAEGQFVAVLMDRCIDLVPALLGAVLAGCAYVPIDPGLPEDRIAYMLRDAAPSVIVTHSGLLSRVDSFAEISQRGLPVLCADQLRADQLRADQLPVAIPEGWSRPPGLSGDGPIYMIYTSGSTGQPKGVINLRSALFNRLVWMQDEFSLQADDRVLQKTPFGFDVSVWEFFWPLMYGARVVLARPSGHQDAEYLTDLIIRREITTLHFVPSMLSAFLDVLPPGTAFGTLRRVITSGEELPHATVRKFSERIPCGLFNLYGPTEAAIDVSSWACRTDYPGNLVPIGRPIANVRLYVVDQALNLLPPGIPGELCIAGVCLAAGYHNRPELTAQKFVPDPFAPVAPAPGQAALMYRSGDLARFLPDGNIQYLGRIDDQVKLRGFRIEPGEIATALREIPGVREAAVVLCGNGASQQLVGYVASADLDEAGALDRLRRHLPAYMVPQAVVRLDALPTTTNGKLDRKSLPDPGAARAATDDGSALAASATPEERVLAAVWREVLGETVHATDHFFRRGGDSLLSVRIAARLRELGYRVDVSDILAHPVLRDLSAVLAERRGTQGVGAESGQAPASAAFSLLDPADARDLAADPAVTDAWPLTALQSGMIYHSMMDEDSAIYHDVFDYELTTPEMPAAEAADRWRRALGRLARRHPALRSRIDLTSYRVPVQLVRADASLPAAVIDVSGRPPHEQDAAIAAWTSAEKETPFAFGAAPLLRVAVHLRSATRASLAFSFHHALLDGWSVAVLVSDLQEILGGLLGAAGLPGDSQEAATAASPPSYSAYVSLERDAAGDPGHAEFWRGLLAGRRPTIVGNSMVAASAEPAEAGFRPVQAEREVPAALVSAAAAAAVSLGVPVKALYAAMHLRALARLTGQASVVTGTVLNGRPELPGGDSLAGLFLNTVPLPVETAVGPVSGLAAAAWAAEQACLPFRRLPLAEIQRATATTEWFDSVFNYTDFHVYDRRPSPVRVSAARYHEQTSFNLVAHVHRDRFRGGVRLILVANAARLSPRDIERYADGFLAAARELADEGAAGASGASASGGDTGDSDGAAQAIATIIGAAVGVPSLLPEDNYVNAGLDSILAVRVLAKLRAAGYRLQMRDLLRQSTARSLATVLTMDTDQSAGLPADQPAELRPFALAGHPRADFPPEVVDAYPVTPMQLHMLRAAPAGTASAPYLDVFRYEIGGLADPERLVEALHTLIGRHDALRTAFELNQAVPLQLVYRQAAPAVAYSDLSERSAHEQRRELQSWELAERRRPFHADQPCLLRAHIHRLGTETLSLGLAFHHAILDGWSLSLLIRDLLRLCAAPAGAPEAAEPTRTPGSPAPRYAQFVARTIADRGSAADLGYWGDALAGAAYPALRIPVQPGASGSGRDPRPAPAGDAGWIEARSALPDRQRQRLTTLAAELGVPLKHIFLAAHLRVVGSLGQSSDVVTGVVTGTRPEWPDADVMIGMFLNFVPFRVRLDSAGWDPVGWRAFIRATFERDIANTPHVRCPYPDIAQAVGRDSLFQTIFNYTNFGAYAEAAGSAESVRLSRVSWFECMAAPLLVNIGHDLRQRITVITLTARTDLFSPDAVDYVGHCYAETLKSIANEVEGK